MQENGSINKPKRQPLEWEKIFAKDGDNKELVSKMLVHTAQYQQKTNNLIKNKQKI